MQEITSVLPYIVFIIPALGAIITGLFGKERGYLREGISILGIILALIISIYLVQTTLFASDKTITYTAFHRNIFIDGFSSMMALIINVMLLLIVLYSFTYMKSLVDSGKIQDSSLRMFYSLVMTFNASMMLTVISNHLIMLYISVEASTLATAILVCFFRDRRGLEGAYKYIVLIIVGIAFALMGCILLYSSVVPHITGHDALLLTEIGEVAALIPKNVALLAVACFIIGFGTKAGLVPFHAWLPDAHAEAPVPISAVLSGIVIKVGAYALARTVTIFTPHYGAVVVFVAVMASVSMFVGIIMAWAQDDLKRLLAFHSVSQMGYVVGGLGLGTYLGIYGGLFHLLNHTVFKSLLFLCAGALMYAAGSRKISELSTMAKKMPITAFCFFVASLSMGGMPPFNGFMSKFTLFLAFADRGLLWVAVVSVIISFLTLGCLAHAAYRIFWGNAASGKTSALVQEIPFVMWAPMVALAGLIILIGVYPQILYPILNSATESILYILKGVGF